jgi:hypothetical protein
VADRYSDMQYILNHNIFVRYLSRLLTAMGIRFNHCEVSHSLAARNASVMSTVFCTPEVSPTWTKESFDPLCWPYTGGYSEKGADVTATAVSTGFRIFDVLQDIVHKQACLTSVSFELARHHLLCASNKVDSRLDFLIRMVLDVVRSVGHSESSELLPQGGLMDLCCIGIELVFHRFFISGSSTSTDYQKVEAECKNILEYSQSKMLGGTLDFTVYNSFIQVQIALGKDMDALKVRLPLYHSFRIMVCLQICDKLLRAVSQSPRQSSPTGSVSGGSNLFWIVCQLLLDYHPCSPDSIRPTDPPQRLSLKLYDRLVHALRVFRTASTFGADYTGNIKELLVGSRLKEKDKQKRAKTVADQATEMTPAVISELAACTCETMTAVTSVRQRSLFHSMSARNPSRSSQRMFEQLSHQIAHVRQLRAAETNVGHLKIDIEPIGKLNNLMVRGIVCQ